MSSASRYAPRTGPERSDDPHLHEALTRLSLGFSKKLTNLRAAVPLHVFHYNFCQILGSLKRTPAMAAGATDRLWTLDDLFG